MPSPLRAARASVRAVISYLQLPPAAKRAVRTDRLGVPSEDPGIDACIRAATTWLRRAQDKSASADGGVSRHFSLLTGWSTSYPETTGYIIPTLLDVARESGNRELVDRARRMLDWLVSIQFDEGGFPGGPIDATPRVPVTFNTGQILIGLARGVADFGDVYAASMHKAARWLTDTLDVDGCWRRHPTPFAAPGEKAYETHVSWGLLEAARVASGASYADAALKQVRWALTKQRPNGWFDDCCLNDRHHPLTHTIGYVLRGILEAYRFSRDAQLLEAATRTGDAIASLVGPDGFLAGRFDSSWKPAVDFACLTGSVQLAHCLLMLYQETGKPVYRDRGFALNRYVRCTVRVEGPDDVCGGVKGSFPIDGEYGRYQYLNWAAKFFIDSNRLERATHHL